MGPLFWLCIALANGGDNVRISQTFWVGRIGLSFFLFISSNQIRFFHIRPLSSYTEAEVAAVSAAIGVEDAARGLRTSTRPDVSERRGSSGSDIWRGL
jgi:hypothetical protein